MCEVTSYFTVYIDRNSVYFLRLIVKFVTLFICFTHLWHRRSNETSNEIPIFLIDIAVVVNVIGIDIVVQRYG